MCEEKAPSEGAERYQLYRAKWRLEKRKKNWSGKRRHFSFTTETVSPCPTQRKLLNSLFVAVVAGHDSRPRG